MLAVQVRAVLDAFVPNPDAKIKKQFDKDCIPVEKAMNFTEKVIDFIRDNVEDIHRWAARIHESVESWQSDGTTPAYIAENLLPSLSALPFLTERPRSNDPGCRSPAPGIPGSVFFNTNTDLVQDIVDGLSELYDFIVNPLKEQPIEAAALIVALNPDSHPLPDADIEALTVAELFREPRVTMSMADPSAIQTHLQTGVEIVIVSGHGDAWNGEQKAVAFVTKTRRVIVHDEDAIVDAFKGHSPHDGGKLFVVILNGCETGHLAEKLKTQAHIPFVVSWGQTSCVDQAAKAFLVGFVLARHRGYNCIEAFTAGEVAIESIFCQPPHGFERPKYALKDGTERVFAGTPQLLQFHSDVLDPNSTKPVLSEVRAESNALRQSMDVRLSAMSAANDEKLSAILEALQRGQAKKGKATTELDIDMLKCKGQGKWLGKGSHGVVRLDSLECEEGQEPVPVAVKVVDITNKSSRKAAEKELYALAKIHHESTVHLFGTVDMAERRELWVVLEYCELGGLDRILRVFSRNAEEEDVNDLLEVIQINEEAVGNNQDKLCSHLEERLGGPLPGLLQSR